MPDGDERQQKAKCPHCKKPMSFLEKRHEMPPFWSMQQRFFGLPFKTDALLLSLLLGLSALAMHLNAIFALLLASILSLVLVNFSVQVARSYSKATRLSSTTGSSSFNGGVPGIASALDFKQAKTSLIITGLLIVCFAPPILLLNYVSGWLALTYALLVLSILPSVLLMLLYSDKRQGGHGSAPPSWMSIIKKMHLSYVSLIAFFAMSYLSVLVIADLLHPVLPSFAFAPVCVLLTAYFVIALFAVLGYVLKRYEFFSSVSSVKALESEQDNTPTDSSQRINADLDIAIKDGDFSKALSLLENSMKGKGKRSDLRVHQLYTLLLERRDLVRLEQHSHLFFELLLGRGQKLAAYELFEMLRNEQEKFLVHDIQLSLDLAEAFYQMKEYKLVLWLAREAHQRFDSCPELAKLYLLAAKTILSKSKTPEKARAFLHYIDENFPDTEFKEAARRLLEHLDSH
ncbi:hypothetical protein A3749_11205 [Oleiphilus sp. HI0078]|nr:hypothetical protein A3729_00440 [Oleiphilus sp. HI0043]KZY42081.1 hypothetical protein A3732_02705 [Oleiphilus sp. HI0050]KZY94932.1 hypothetical protein A3743_05830 [Oleiphilus sp. HI0072]KZZ10380.1 hypothetical protein A3749_11205 [Oleiphilus sp. HI0078]KZZ31682.1 hypothetical protein A3756_06640 [Oleiphilus sp. HI0086]KZZ33180.1 hypothetical protein A3757_04125 [Oleiphilus sp. HI0117]KZZ65488.1 hypothetical protein A3763_04320 [Oleiphilus sp. HI0128]